MKNKALIVILVVAAALRLYKLGSVPVSMFGDELDVGYHAFSLLKTGKDYSGNFLPIHLQSLAEFRTPLYLYSAIPTVALFGISPLGVRLPAALFGILGVWAFYLLVKQFSNNEKLSLLSAALLALSPWHIQYSRAAFEVTEMLFFLFLGLHFFLKSLGQKGKWLWVAAASFALLPWIYSTAKLFTPILLIFLTLAWFKSLVGLPRKQIIYAVIALAVIGTPIAVSTIFGGGAGRFGYIGIFTDPTLEPEIGTARMLDASVRGNVTTGLSPTITDRLFHNKIVFWTENVTRNYLQTFSSDFLFGSGDPNPRHSIMRMGQLYKIEIAALILGIIYFFKGKADKKIKSLIIFWLLVGAFPASLTRDGGNHATRLILTLPPLMLLVAYGINSFPKKIYQLAYIGIFLLGFVFYQHNFWVHNPWGAERWWHAGWAEAISEVKSIDSNYDKVVITMADEPAWIFFAAHYEYDPADWHANFPVGNDTEVEGFGKVSHIGKFHFGSPSGRGLYEFGQVIDEETLYLASAKEVNVNLIAEPERTPGDLKLLKSISFPSGEPAFYLFSGNDR